jgi:hypothetical protein
MLAASADSKFRHGNPMMKAALIVTAAVATAYVAEKLATDAFQRLIGAPDVPSGQ